MKKILKQVAGIDVAAKELVVSLGRMEEDLTVEIHASKAFANSLKGFKELISWVDKHRAINTSVLYAMEATGVYHESLAYFLYDQGYELSVVLPNKISNYSRTLEVKTVTDKTSSQAIARFGLERKLDLWKKPKEVYRKLRELSREREQLVVEKTELRCKLHAQKSSALPSEASLKRLKTRIALIDKQEKQIRKEMLAIVRTEEDLSRQIDRICTIPGVGELTSLTVLAETNGFELIRNKKQLVSYSGLDVKEKQSGTSVKGKPRISKRGNRFLRKAMHFPALTAIRVDERFKAIFVRLVSKHGIKMKACVAVQRKLLEMIYVIWKSGAEYDRNYFQKDKEQVIAA